jgi:SAM-dependent methyltransferase
MSARDRFSGILKRALLACVSGITGRHAVLLPREAVDESALLAVRAPYRVDGSRLSLKLGEAGPGRISAVLLGYVGHFPTREIWRGAERDFPGPCSLRLDLATGSVHLGSEEWGRVPLPLPGRRFCWRLELVGASGVRRHRVTGHYQAGADREVGAAYFAGDTYVDHEAQSAGDHREIVACLRRQGAKGTVLEVGCATGGLLSALDAAGLAAVGVDISSWAVAQAGQRLGPGRAWVCDVERDPLPAAVKAKAPFGALVLAAILEHFGDPFGTLSKLTELTESGAVLVVTTTNADSLTRRLFGDQWEGHYDATHLGIDRVSVGSLREELPRLGWRIVELESRLVWDAAADPTRATLREWCAADARFRRLLAERDLGDYITCVAVRE